MVYLRMLLLLAIPLLAGCASGPFKSGGPVFESKADKTLASGIALYDDGKYPEATQTLQDALSLGLNPDNQVKAHKYLAFTQCVSGKEKLCREEFRKILEINPAFDLAPSEAGHPIWGPVFKSIKAKKTDPKK